MTKERNAETIEKEMKKSQEIVKKEQNKIRSLNAELTTAKKREKARRYQAIGSAMEKVLGIGELSNDDITTLINCLKVKAYSKDGTVTTTAERLANAIKEERGKISAMENTSSAENRSAASKPSAVPSERQDFDGGESGSSLPLFHHQSPNSTSL